MEISDFQRLILEWGRHNRRDMPWRNTRDPYKILVSEVMLQQTQVSRVLPKYETFLREFPTAEALADASQPNTPSHVAGTWLLEPCVAPPGRRWHDRQRVRRQLPARPCNADDTARHRPVYRGRRGLLRVRERRAVPRHQYPACLPVLLLSGRGRRSRQSHHGDRPPGRVDSKTPASGATLCSTTARVELRDRTINRRSRHYSRQSAFEGSFRSFRTQALRHVLAQENTSLSRAELKDFLAQRLAAGDHPYTPQDVLDALINDGLLRLTSDDRVLV